MKIYLIRHGETTGDIEGRYGGNYDDHLTEKGKQQAEALAKKILDAQIEIIYHSPLLRAKETATILAEQLSIETKEENELRERNAYGVLSGLTKQEAQKKHPEDYAELQRDKLHHNVSKSESYTDLEKRMRKIFTKLCMKNSHKHIAIISHGGMIRCFVRDYLKIGELDKLGDCALISIERKEDMLLITGLDGASLEQ